MIVLTDSDRLISEMGEETHAEVETSPGAGRALVLDRRLDGLSTVRDGDHLPTERVRVSSSGRVELTRVDGDGVLGVGVVDSARTEADWEGEKRSRHTKSASSGMG